MQRSYLEHQRHGRDGRELDRRHEPTCRQHVCATGGGNDDRRRKRPERELFWELEPNENEQMRVIVVGNTEEEPARVARKGVPSQGKGATPRQASQGSVGDGKAAWITAGEGRGYQCTTTCHRKQQILVTWISAWQCELRRAGLAAQR